MQCSGVCIQIVGIPSAWRSTKARGWITKLHSNRDRDRGSSGSFGVEIITQIKDNDPLTGDISRTKVLSYIQMLSLHMHIHCVCIRRICENTWAHEYVYWIDVAKMGLSGAHVPDAFEYLFNDFLAFELALRMSNTCALLNNLWLCDTLIFLYRKIFHGDCAAHVSITRMHSLHYDNGWQNVQHHISYIPRTRIHIVLPLPYPTSRVWSSP